jgi:dephospho-CoA kinase
MSSHQCASPQPHQRRIGLTGGIGMGKTTVSNYLASHHQIPVLDADVIAREAVDLGTPLLHELKERYGTSILLSNGMLDRYRLADIIFQSSAERLWLEQRIHPIVRDRFESALLELPTEQYPIVVLVVPLLFEARMTDLVNEIWVIHCNQNQQIQRLIEREQERLNGDLPDLGHIQARIDSQMPIEKKLHHATVVLDNSSTLEALLAQVDQALQQDSVHSNSSCLNSPPSQLPPS